MQRWADAAFPAYPAMLLTLAVWFAYRIAFLNVEWLALAYSCALAATALGFRQLRTRESGCDAGGPLWPRQVRITCGASIGASAALFALAGLVSLHSMTRLTLPYYDQEAYIGGAIAVRDCGGPLGALGRCFTGQFPHSNREPLFLLVLSSFAHEGPSFFETGKYVTLVCGVLAVASAGIVAWKVFNPVAGVVTCFCLSMNHFTLQHSTLVSSEPLSMFFTIWALYFILAGVKRRRLWIIGGAMAGLAHLSKSTGILLCGAFAVAVLAMLRGKAFREKHSYLFVAAFVLACMPFFVNATVRYGNPLYVPKGAFIWADSWDEASKITPERLPQYTFLNYVRTHRLAEAWSRLWSGARGVARCTRNLAELRILLLKYTYGGSVLLLAGIALLFDPDRFRRTFFVAFGAMFGALLSWHSAINLSERHLLPLLPFVFAYFGQFLSQVCVPPRAPAAARRVALAHIVAACVGIVFMLVVKGHRIFTTT